MVTVATRSPSFSGRAVGPQPIDIKAASSLEPATALAPMTPPPTAAAAPSITTTTLIVPQNTLTTTPRAPPQSPQLPTSPHSPKPPPPALRVPEASLIETRLTGAVHLLRIEANALQALAALYEANPACRDGFSRAISAISRHRNSGDSGKVVFTGVGKSGWIAKKLVATFTSLGLPAVFLHPTEALHGDLGIVAAADTIVMISFSGRTPELLALLPHLKPSCPLVLMTAPMAPDGCAIAQRRPGLILVPTPIPEPEAQTFGVSAPTTSTTMAIAVGDALAFVASREMYASVATVFGENHPGGAIGQAYKSGSP